MHQASRARPFLARGWRPREAKAAEEEEGLYIDRSALAGHGGWRRGRGGEHGADGAVSSTRLCTRGTQARARVLDRAGDDGGRRVLVCMIPGRLVISHSSEQPGGISFGLTCRTRVFWLLGALWTLKRSRASVLWRETVLERFLAVFELWIVIYRYFELSAIRRGR